MGSPVEAAHGDSLAASLPEDGEARQRLLEAVVRTAAGVFEAASASVALRDDATSELVFRAAWGMGADGVVGVRLRPGEGIAGAALAEAEPVVVPDCRSDSASPRRSRPVSATCPTRCSRCRSCATMSPWVLSVLDRRDGGPYGQADVRRAELFADLTVSTLGS